MKKVLLLIITFNFSFLSAQQGTWFWGNNGIGDGYLYSIASDNHGNCYISGMFENDTIHFNSYTLKNSTETNPPYSSDFDAFLVKYDQSGNILWATQTFEKNSKLRGGNDAPESVYTDILGNVYVSGNFIDTLFIGSYTLITSNTGFNPQNMYLAKYTATGNLLWVKQAICANDSSFINEDAMSTDKNGNVYITGQFYDTVRIGSYLLVAPPLSHNTFLAKYDSNGNVIWAKQSMGNKHNNEPWGVVNDKYGNTFVTGSFYDSVTFGAYELITISPNSDFFIIKYDPGGNVLWAKTAITPGSLSNGVGLSLTTDLTGNAYVGGVFQDTLVFAQDTIISSPNSFFLTKYAPNDSVLWTKSATILDANYWSLCNLSSDNSKHVYLSANEEGGGSKSCEIAFGNDTLRIYDTAAFDGASVVFKLDSNGNVLCSSVIPVGGGGGLLTLVSSDTSGNHIYVGGAAKSVAVFGSDTVNPFSISTNPTQRINYFPFVARWEECDSNVLYAAVQNQKPIETDVQIYPTPSTGIFTIALNHPEAQTIEVYNMLGKKVYSQFIVPSSSFRVDLKNQPNGVYLYRLISENGGLIGEGKLMIQSR